MAEDRNDPSAHQSTFQIPPPTDPYVTFQTPYPRKLSDEAYNPFIEFRRLADSAFSSFFSGLPRLLGTEQFKQANIRSSEQEHTDFFDRQAKEFERRIAEMARVQAEEAEGLRKRLEQDWEERRQENENRMEEESRRWDMMRRGLEKCPGLRSDRVHAFDDPESELALYDGLNAYEASAYRPAVETQEDKRPQHVPNNKNTNHSCQYAKTNPSQSGWFGGLGHDGKRRASHITVSQAQTRESKIPPDVNAEWQEYKDEEMDPFSNDDHLVPWLTLSHYSPLSLVGAQAWLNESGQGHMARYAETVDLSEIAWDDAFEDLICVHKTGRLPEPSRRLVYWGGPNQWMTEMALRGSLGPNWGEGFMLAALMNAVEDNRWKGFDGFRGQCTRFAGREFRRCSTTLHESTFVDPQHMPLTVLDRTLFEPFALDTDQQQERPTQHPEPSTCSPERAFGAHSMFWPSPMDVMSALFKFDLGDLEEEVANIASVNDDTKDRTASQGGPASSTVTACSRLTQDQDRPEGIVSTYTITTSRTLPDGSVEVKTSRRQRFTDGVEEQSESTEVKPSRTGLSDDAKTQTLKDVTTEQNTNSGWFWNR